MIGKGIPGNMTKNLQKAFWDIIENGNDKHNWLTFLDGENKIINMPSNVKMQSLSSKKDL